MSKTYKIGTRGSLLALTQCNLFKNQLENASGLNFELEIIKTLGDIQTDKPLWQMDGKDFFTRELDTALLSGNVDMVVHSYKDLGSDRPEGINLSCISKRSYANDILLIKKSSIPKIKEMKVFKVGTSSPRRIINTEKKLKSFLPLAPENLEIKCEMLRGNVNTRIQKLLDQDMDAIVLALAGLERLASNNESRLILKELVKDLDFMVMPQDHFPSSASQGALAIETSDKTPKELIDALALLDDSKTREEVKRERKAFNSFGGGCHLAVGINVKSFEDKFIHVYQGEHKQEQINVFNLEGQDYSALAGKTFVLPSSKFNLIKKTSNDKKVKNNSNLFVTSKHCLHSLDQSAKYSSVWAAGSSTHKELSKAGYWVNGNCNSLGAAELENLRNSKAVSLFLKDDSPWFSLSHSQASSEIGELFHSYSRSTESDIDLSLISPTSDCIYWTSFNEFSVLTTLNPKLKNKIHLCGLGKTYSKFKEKNISVIPFINTTHARKILKEL